MERVKRIYQIKLLGDTYDLTEEEFKQLQEECREIAAYGEEREETPRKDILDIAWEYIKSAKVVIPEADTEEDPITLTSEPPADGSKEQPAGSEVFKDSLAEGMEDLEKGPELVETEKPKAEKAVAPVPYEKYADMLESGKTRQEMITYIAEERGVSEASAAAYVTKAKRLTKGKSIKRKTRADYREEQEARDIILKASDATKCTPSQCREIASWQHDMDDYHIAQRAGGFGGYVKAEDVIKAYDMLHGEE